MLIFPSAFRLLSQSLSILFIRSTALSSVLPEPMRMASNSAFVSDSAPIAASFSRGRSSSAHWFMLSLELRDASLESLLSLFSFMPFVVLHNVETPQRDVSTISAFYCLISIICIINPLIKISLLHNRLVMAKIVIISQTAKTFKHSHYNQFIFPLLSLKLILICASSFYIHITWFLQPK